MVPEKEIDAFVKKHLCGPSQGAHSYEHTIRVYQIVSEIGHTLNANMRVLGPAALLHDIGRLKETETGVSHAILSGEMSEKLLEHLGFSVLEIESIKAAIRTHRFSEGIEPTSLEGRILSDADKLDAMGAIGVFRAIAHAAVTSVGIKGFLSHADEKLLKLHKLMYTEPAKNMALSRHDVLSAFVEQLRTELEVASV